MEEKVRELNYLVTLLEVQQEKVQQFAREQTQVLGQALAEIQELLFHPVAEIQKQYPLLTPGQALAQQVHRLVQAQKLVLEEDLVEEQAKVLAEAEAEGALEEQALELVQQQAEELAH